MLRHGKLPNLAKLIEGGAFADDVMPGVPSLTAPGFASLLTGASPRITGITGNRVPRSPRNEFTILESAAGFNPALQRAETIFTAAERAGRKVVALHVPFVGEKSRLGVLLTRLRGNHRPRRHHQRTQLQTPSYRFLGKYAGKRRTAAGDLLYNCRN